MLAEFLIAKDLDHPNIVKLVESFDDAICSFLIFELCEHKTLRDYLALRGRLNEPEIKFFMRQVVNGLMYLHHNKIIHRDIKLGNILLTKHMQIKIADFGLSEQMWNLD